MTRYRNTSWFSCLSLLLMVVFIQAQASGCCKIGSWFRATSGEPTIVDASEGTTQSATEAASEPTTGRVSARDHSCCPKKDASGPETPKASTAPGSSSESAAAFPAHACSTSGHGCCLQGAGLNASGLVSLPSGPSVDAALPILVPTVALLALADAGSPVSCVRLDSGPPGSHSNLPLLI